MGGFIEICTMHFVLNRTYFSLSIYLSAAFVVSNLIIQVSSSWIPKSNRTICFPFFQYDIQSSIGSAISHFNQTIIGLTVSV